MHAYEYKTDLPDAPHINKPMLSKKDACSRCVPFHLALFTKFITMIDVNFHLRSLFLECVKYVFLFIY